MSTYHGLAVHLDLTAQVHHIEGQAGDAACVRVARLRQPRHGHVLVAHGLHLQAERHGLRSVLRPGRPADSQPERQNASPRITLYTLGFLRGSVSVSKAVYSWFSICTMDMGSRCAGSAHSWEKPTMPEKSSVTVG